MIFLFYILYTIISGVSLFPFVIVLGLCVDFGVGVGHIHNNDREDPFITSEFILMDM